MTVRVLGRSPSYARPERLGTTNDAAAYDLLTSAVWYIDAESPGTQGVTVPNLGTGGSALDAQYGSTSGADTNDPLLLAHTGTSYLYLSGVAGNSVSCTAPASAASYAAYPVGGGAASTGAATGGAAFTFSTAGSWLHVDLLNGSAEVVASFDATALTTGAATGQTDAYSVAWTINRGTSGRKAVAVVAPVFLFGTDDYLEVADNDLLDFGAADDFTVLAVYRGWATLPSAQTYVWKGLASSGARWGLLGYPWSPVLHDGTTGSSVGTETLTLGGTAALTGVFDRTAQTATSYLNGTATDADADISDVGSVANAEVLRVGRRGGAGSNYADGEFFAAAVFRRALTAGEIGVLSAYFTARVGA